MHLISKTVSLVLLIFFLFIGNAVGQNYKTVVNLKDGSVLEGQLIEYRDGEFIRMKLGESEIKINFESIKNIRHEDLKFAKPYSFSEKGYYHHTSLVLLPGYVSAGNPTMGFGLDHSSGFLFNRWISAGLNLGINNYHPGSREVLYNFAAEVRGYLLSRNISPYYVLRAGYGYAHTGSNFQKAQGGLFMNPGLGIRFGSGPANFIMELGTTFQKAYFEQQMNTWWNNGLLQKEVFYRRFTMKFGILF